MLGGLYQPGEVPSFEGVIGKNLSNPIPEWAQHGAGRKLVPYGIASNMNTPTPDPGEEYPHINTDLFGIQNQQNRNVPLAKMVPPFNAPVDSATPSMDGFVTDYISAFFSTSFPACAAHPHNERRTANAFVIASTAIREYAHDGVESASSFQPLTNGTFRFRSVDPVTETLAVSDTANGGVALYSEPAAVLHVLPGRELSWLERTARRAYPEKDWSTGIFESRCSSI